MRAPALASATRPAPVRSPAIVPPAPVRPASRAGPALLSGAGPAFRLGAGRPLAAPLRRRLESTFGTDLGGVRVHDDSRAARTADFLGAKAFAFGPSIVLGSRAHAGDLGLMAHETAHTLQQAGVPVPQPYGPGTGDAHESEAHRASQAALQGERFAVMGRTNAAQVQGLFGFGSPLDYLADKANLIPGFRMFTILLGVNPINLSPVERSAANVLRALIEFIPGGALITQALDNHGVFAKVGAWVNDQVATLGLSATAIKQAVSDFIKSLSWGDVTDLGGVWERAKKIFTDPIERIINFARSLLTGVLKLIKEAILRPIARLAEGTEGYNLLKGVMGEDPITGEPVKRTPENLLGPFMKLIGQGEIWENLQKANAIPRAWAWFQGALSGLLGFVRQIPALFVSAFQALELVDLILLPRAFLKLAGVFGGFLVKFITWGANAAWTLLEIVFDVVSPGAWGYIKKTGAALKSILKNPLPFVGNLVKAAKLGFQNFGGNFLTHLKNGLLNWLLGALPGVYIPKAFALGEIVKFVFSVLGVTWAQIRQKLVKATSETVVVAMETAVDIVVILVRDGPAAAWDKIKEELASLKDKVIGGITDFVIDTVVTKAVPKLVAMFIPGAGFITAIMAIYDTVMVFVNKIAQIIQVVKGFIDSIVAIAGGAIDAAAAKVEGILAGLLSLAINFLAGFVGLGKVADKITGVITKVRDVIDKALDKLVAMIVTAARKLWNAAKAKVSGWWKATKEFAAVSGEKHTLLLKSEGANARLIIKSDPIPYETFVNCLTEPTTAKGAKAAAILIAKDIDKAINLAAKNTDQKDPALKPVDLKDDPTKAITDLLAKLAEATKPLLAPSGSASSPPVYGPLQNGFGTSVLVARLTKDDKGGSQPSVDGEPWDTLVQRTYGGGSYYVRGHLLNHNLGGTGKSWQNLTPLTQNANNRALESMLAQFEAPVKKKAETDTLTFQVKVNYGHPVPLEADANKILKDPAEDANRKLIARIILAEKYVPKTLTCSASVLDPAGKKPPTLFKSFTVDNTTHDKYLADYKTNGKQRPELKLFKADAKMLDDIKVPAGKGPIIQSSKPKEWGVPFQAKTGLTLAEQDTIRFNVHYRIVLE